MAPLRVVFCTIPIVSAVAQKIDPNDAGARAPHNAPSASVGGEQLDCACGGEFSQGDTVVYWQDKSYSHTGSPPFGSTGVVVAAMAPEAHGVSVLVKFDSAWSSKGVDNCDQFAECGQCPTTGGETQFWATCEQLTHYWNPPPSPPAPVMNGWIRLHNTESCLEFNGNPLKVAECDVAGKAQTWSATDGQIKYVHPASHSSQSWCLDIPFGDFKETNYAQIWECNGLPQQQWGVDASAYTIYLSLTNTDATRCLESESLQPGASVMIGACRNSDVQMWDFVKKIDVSV